jgi:2-iminobutanoate/2-iminopropanoate deaminase
MSTRWHKEIVRAERAPVTRGPTSAHAVRVGPLLFVTGQSGRRPGEDGYLADPAEHARQSMENVKAIVEAGGSTMDNVIKRTVIVRDAEAYQHMRAVVESYFPSPVASTTLRGELMADDMLLEVEVIAVVPDAQAS